MLIGDLWSESIHRTGTKSSFPAQEPCQTIVEVQNYIELSENGTINSVKIMFSVKSAFLIDALFRVDWGLMKLHTPQDRYKEVTSSPSTMSNRRGGPKLH
eukprot:scaffold223606_cov35-Attheya_sp.AAC.1